MTKFKTVYPDEQYWLSFCQNNNNFTQCAQTDLRDSSIPVPNITGTDYANDMATLKHHLKPDAFVKLSGRYRQYKLRHNRQLKTVTLHQNTLNRLKAYSLEQNVYFHSLDELLEYMMDPEATLEPVTTNDTIPSSLTLPQSFKITREKLKLRISTWRTILAYIDFSYRAGWLACKHLSGAKRTEKALEEHASRFILDSQVDDR